MKTQYQLINLITGQHYLTGTLNECHAGLVAISDGLTAKQLWEEGYHVGSLTKRITAGVSGMFPSSTQPIS